MSYIRVKLDSPSLIDGPGRVIAVDLDEPAPNTLRVGEADWQDDCREMLVRGDRVKLGTFGVRKLPGDAVNCRISPEQAHTAYETARRDAWNAKIGALFIEPTPLWSDLTDEERTGWEAVVGLFAEGSE